MPCLALLSDVLIRTASSSLHCSSLESRCSTQFCARVRGVCGIEWFVTVLTKFMVQIIWVQSPVQMKSHKSSFIQNFCQCSFFFCLLASLLSFIRVSVFNSLVRLQEQKWVYLPLPLSAWSPWWVCTCLMSLCVPWTVLWSNYLERQRNEREHLTFKSLSARRPGVDDTNTQTNTHARPHIILKCNSDLSGM